MGKRSRKHEDDTPTSSSSPWSSDDSESSSKRRLRHRKVKERRKKRERERSRKKSRREMTKKKRDYESSDDGSGSDFEPEISPEVVRNMFTQFPNVGNDLKTLLRMIDDGQAVDIRGISERSLSKHLRKLFLSLNLGENKDRVFLRRPKDRPTLDVVGTLIETHMESKEQQPDESAPMKHVQPEVPEAKDKRAADDNLELPGPMDDSPGPKKRVIGPAVPSAELLAAAAKLTEAQAELW